jgi:hypothetical protein
MLPKLIFEEIQNSIDILSNEADEVSRIDAGYLETCITKLQNYEELSENEREVLEGEFHYWIRDNGFYSSGRGKKLLVKAMAKLGFLEVYDPNIYSMKPKTNVVEGVEYVTW